MIIEVLKSKIHSATVTEANLDYIGSIAIDEYLMEAANIIENEKVSIYDITNGNRLDTYVIKGKRGSDNIVMNGAAAWKVFIGDLITIISFAGMNFEEAKSFKPHTIFPDKNNHLR